MFAHTFCTMHTCTCFHKSTSNQRATYQFAKLPEVHVQPENVLWGLHQLGVVFAIPADGYSICDFIFVLVHAKPPLNMGLLGMN